MTTDAQRRAVKKYDDKLDHIHLRLKKGRRSEIENHIENTDDISVQAFISRAITETMQRDNNSE